MAGPTIVDLAADAAPETPSVVIVGELSEEQREQMNAALGAFKGTLPVYAAAADHAAVAPHVLGDGLYVFQATSAVAYAGDLADAEAVRSFVDAERVPLVSRLGPSNFSELNSLPGRDLVVLMIDNADEAFATKDAAFADVARDLKADGGFVFATLDTAAFQGFAANFTDVEELPKVVVLRLAQSSFFVADLDEATPAWLRAVAAGEVEASTLSH
eukprot:gnl/Ergobibamus_cyprinoides/952.p2 GENE.gnl/Ergobibamus_cyprinoides/952~~gnl/Ergobibamus_cyprinoides/952.p2  ORF type:complete len:229 (-),score=129.32 gnl/Ergobibamus_cyprinoides/952:23-667(-)